MRTAFRDASGSPGRDVVVFWCATGIVALHAIVDAFIGTEPGTDAGDHLLRGYHRAASAPKTIWKIPEAGHVGGFEARPREYEKRVVGFFDEALLGS